MSIRFGEKHFLSKAGRVVTLFATAALAGCINVHPFDAPANVQAVSIEIGGYGREEDKFRLYIDEPSKVIRVVEAVNGSSGRWKIFHSEQVQDGSSAEILFYNAGSPVYRLYAYHNAATDGDGSYDEVGTDLVSRQWWTQFE